MITSKPITTRERIAILVEAACMARENAKVCRQMARAWPDDRREWTAADMTKAHQAFIRAYGYLRQARQLRSAQ